MTDFAAGIAAKRNEPLVAALIPPAVSTKQPVKHQPSDYKWINENKGKLLESGWGQLNNRSNTRKVNETECEI